MGKVRQPSRAPRRRRDVAPADPAPARGPAPRWLRGLVLGGVGLLLALPAVLAVATGQWSGSKAAVGEAAQKFLDAVHDHDQEALEPLISTGAGAANRLPLDMIHLGMPLLRGRIDNVVLQDANNATAYYTLRREDAADKSLPLKNLLRDLDAIGQVRGRFVVPLPAATVALVLQNHCQKEVESVRVKLAYQDAAGRPLGETVRTEARVEPGGDRLAVLSSGPVMVEEPELPDGAVKATLTVLAVGFTDGTAWPP